MEVRLHSCLLSFWLFVFLVLKHNCWKFSYNEGKNESRIFNNLVRRGANRRRKCLNAGTEDAHSLKTEIVDYDAHNAPNLSLGESLA